MTDVPLGKAAPCLIMSLLLYQRLEIERLVILIRLGTRIRQKTFLIELFGCLESSAVALSSIHAKACAAQLWMPACNRHRYRPLSLKGTHIQYAFGRHV